MTNRRKDSRLLVGAAAVLCAVALRAEPTSENNERLRLALEKLPAADLNHDGILTATEGREYLAARRGGVGRARAGRDEPAATYELPPTFVNERYGPHPSNVLDLWQASSERPSPVVVFIHGGGFVGGDKARIATDDLRTCLDAGVSFASINYRFRKDAPIQDILRDAARAVQFIRAHATSWHLDKARVAAYGGSAGAGTSAWLAFHDDLADPAAADPVLRESTRLIAAAMNNGQFSYDLVQWGDELFNRPLEEFADDVRTLYHVDGIEALQSPEMKRIRADVDMRGLISADDPPVYLFCSMPDGKPTDRNHLVHHPRHAQLIKKRCDELGVEAVLNLPRLGIAPPKDETAIGFLLRKLKEK